MMDKLPKPLREPRKKHPLFVVVKTPVGDTRQYGGSWLAQRQGNAKGGQIAQARGTGYRWDSESARQAALKAWQTRWRKVRGIRIGRRAKQRPRVLRAPLRAIYALEPKNGIQYSPALKVWVITDDQGTRCLSERTALQKLGHLPTGSHPFPRLLSGMNRAPSGESGGQS